MQPIAEPVVYIVDDDEAIRVSLARALRTRGYAVVAFPSAQAFLDGYVPEQTGCLILDYGMPDMSGLELQEHLVARKISIPIIFITGHGGISESVRAMKLGAIDFLEKPFQQETLVKQIESAFQMDASARRIRDKTDSALALFGNLTEREKEVAKLLVTHPSSSTSKDIARHLGISPRTVDHHRARILEKMRVQSVAELVDVANRSKLFS
ncbi:MAG: response regulator [Sulfitobacter sp.]